MRDHVYYLHTNGELIHKNYTEGIEADFRESDFVKAFWVLDPEDRETAWTLLVEALAAVLGTVLICLLYIAGKKFLDDFMFDHDIDQQLKTNIAPENYQKFKEFTGLKSTLKRWIHGKQQ